MFEWFFYLQYQLTFNRKNDQYKMYVYKER